MTSLYYHAINIVSVWRPIINQNQESATGERFEASRLSMLARTLLVALPLFTAAVRFVPRINSVLGLVIVFNIVEIFEEFRSAGAADRLAIDLFKKQTSVPDDAMKFLATHPYAVKQLIAQPGCNINKTSAFDGQTLLEQIVQSKKTNGLFNEEKSNAKLRLSTLKLLIESGQVTAKDLFSHQAIFTDPDFVEILIGALERDKLQRGNLTPSQVYHAWLLANNANLARLLAKRGFNINAENEKGETALFTLFKQWAEHGHNTGGFEKIFLLLKNGATLPPDDALIEFEKGGQIVRKTVKEFVDEKHSLKTAIEQTKDIQPEAPGFYDGNPGVFSLKPAIKVANSFDSFKVNQNLLILRVGFIAFPIITFVASVILTLATPLPLVVGVVASGLLFMAEWSRAARKLSSIAIQQFNHGNVTHSMLEYIAKDKKLIGQLIEKKVDFNTIDEKGNNLWDAICEQGRYSWNKIDAKTHFANFKMLADRFFADTVPGALRCSYFIKAVRTGKPEFVEYLLASKKVVAADFSSDEEFACWTGLRNPQIAVLLKANGFDPNAVNGRGFTPLLATLQSYGELGYMLDDKFNKYLHVNALLDAGADPKATVQIEDDQKVLNTKTALELARGNAPIVRLLTERLNQN